MKGMAEDSLSEKEITPEEEIRRLELKLEEKKRELTERGIEFPKEKEALREVLREHIAEFKSGPEGTSASGGTPLMGGTGSLTDDQQKKADELAKKEERKEQVRALVEYALTKSIAEAVKIAEASTPWLVDELHDHLVDDYYDKLVALRKIKEL